MTKNREYISGKKCRIYCMTSSGDAGITATKTGSTVTGFTVATPGGDIFLETGVGKLEVLVPGTTPTKHMVGDLQGVEIEYSRVEEEIEMVDGTWDTHTKPQSKEASVTLTVLRNSNLYERLFELAPMGVTGVGALQNNHQLRHPGFGYRIIVDRGNSSYDIFDHLTITAPVSEKSDKYAVEVQKIKMEGKYWLLAQALSATGVAIPLTGGM